MGYLQEEDELEDEEAEAEEESLAEAVRAGQLLVSLAQGRWHGMMGDLQAQKALPEAVAIEAASTMDVAQCSLAQSCRPFMKSPLPWLQ